MVTSVHVIVFHRHNKAVSLDILIIGTFRIVHHVIPGRAGRDILQVLCVSMQKVSGMAVMCSTCSSRLWSVNYSPT